MKQYYNLLLLIAFSFLSCFTSFSQITIISSSLSNNLTACLNDATYTVSVNNLSPYNLSDVTVKLVLPEGVQYISSSASGGTEAGMSGTDTVLFTMPAISSLTQVSFSVKIQAGCMSNYTAISNQFIMSYTGDNGIGGIINSTDIHQSNLYTISVPDLALVNMTNQTYSGNIGDVITRCITITNGGNGSLSEFELEHLHGTGIFITSSTAGTSTATTNGTVHLFTAADFSTIGNGNSTLDPGESITICETIEIVSCTDAQSVYNYSWGCGNETCQQLSDAANVVFNSETPNLVIVPWNSFTNNAANGLGTNCYGNNANGDFPSSLTIVNNGTGDAINTLIDIAGAPSTSTAWMQTNYYSSINISSLTIEINNGGQQPLIPVSTQNGQSKPCLPANPKNGLTVNIPLIEPGDQVVIRWNHYTCCVDYCENTVRKHLLHWRYRGSYSNNCGTNYDIPQSNALPSSGGAYYMRNQITPDIVPGTMVDNESSTVTFMAVNSEFTFPRTNNHRFKYRVILPDLCLSVDPGSLVIRNHLGVVQNHVPAMQTSGDTVDFVFTSIPMGTQWTVSFDLSVDCASCPVEGIKTLQFQTLYAPNINCECWQLMGCTSASIDVLCPPICEGINQVNKSVRRINLGLPDNNNDGLPDAGPHNMNLVRTDRLMHGDTLEVFNAGYIHNPNNASFRSVILNHTMTSHGQRMTYSHSLVRVYKASSNTYYSSTSQNINLSVSTTATTTRKWKNGFNINALPSLGMGANDYLETGDSVLIYSYYVNTVNNNSNYLDVVNTESQLYTTANPAFETAPQNELYGCNVLNKEFNLIGWYYTNSGENSLSTQNCDEIVLTQSYYLSIGPCCNNYNGGNLFPFEYRHWSAPANLFVELPDEYQFVSAEFNFNGTGGTLVTRADNFYRPITPASVNGLIYEFDVNSYFGPQGSGAAIVYGDDGFSGTLRVRIRPTCNTENDTKKTRYKWDYKPVPQLNPAEYAPTGWATTDPVTYSGPILTMQSNILMVNSQTGQENWDLTFQNTSNSSNASNFWIGAPASAGISGDSLLNPATNTWFYPNANGIFNLPDLLTNSSVTYRLYTTVTSCQPSSIVVYSGWGCSGVPQSVADYECTPLSLTLSVTPLTPSFESQISLLGTGGNDLCSELDFAIVVRNYQLGYGFNMSTDIQLPYGLELIPGTASLLYQGTTIPLPDPVLISGTNYQWDLSAVTLLENGLIGIVDEANNRFTIHFKARPLCGFNSGQRVFVRSTGQSFCGSNHQSELNYSSPIVLNNMSSPYTTDINIGIDFITPCGPNNQTTLSIYNQGVNPFGNQDSIVFVLPTGLTYTPNSFVPVHNAAIAQTEPVINSSGVQTLLTWPLLPGVQMNDSMVFRIDLTPSPIDLPCATTELRAFTNVLLSANCSIDNNLCETGLITGESSKFIYIYKTDLEATNAHSNVHLNADGSEVLSGSFTLYNQGAALSSNYSLVYEIIQDVNGDGIFSTGDTVVWTQTTTADIAGGTSETFTFSNIPVTQFCGGSIRMSLVNNSCFCSDNIFTFNLTTTATNFADTLCSHDTIQIAYPDISNFIYSWSPATNLSSGTAAQPLFSAANTGSSPVSNTYIRTVDKGFCIHTDTSTIVINPLPQADFLINDTIICQNTSALSIPVYGFNSSPDYTFVYTVNGQTNTATSSDTFNHILTTATAGTYTIQLQSITDGSNRSCSSILTDTVSIQINPAPVAHSSGDTTICLNTSGIFLSLTGSDATGEYTFTYVLNGDTLHVQSTNNTVQIPVPTTNSDTINYQVINVTESSSAQCETALNLTNQFIVLPLPEAFIEMDSIVCENDPAFSVNITGSNSTAPYTFEYTINGVPGTGTGNPGFTIVQNTSAPDTFVYHLTQVTDGSAGSCFSMPDTSVMIIVNPLPAAHITGDTSVCHLSGAPQVTFVGENGTAPYTFTYTYNGDTLQITAPVDSVNLLVSTATVGSFPIQLIGVTDASPSVCSTVIQSSVTVDVLPNPVAFIDYDTIVCQGSTEPIVTFTGGNATSDYTFEYTLNGVDSTLISSGNNAEISIPTSSAGTFEIRLLNVSESSVASCSSDMDTTITILVNPLPTVQISGDTSVCELDPEPVITFTASDATAPYWVYFTMNNTPDSILTNGSTVHYPVSTTTPGLYTFELTGVKESSVTACYQSVSGSAAVLVRERPVATITGTTEVCREPGNAQVVLTGNGTTGPYTFEYTVNGLPMSITSTGDSAVILQSTATSGDYIYHLTGVTDNTVNSCSRTLDEEILVRVNELPIAFMSGDASICLNTDPAIVQFNGEMGTPGYTFYYTIPELNYTDSINSGDLPYVTLPSINDQTGTFTYLLTGVRDASNTQCYSAITDTVVINVIELPAASITGFSPVCQYQPEPVLIFSGSNGGTPYTFEYNLNGVPFSVTTVSADTFVTISQPTDVAGSYTYDILQVTEGTYGCTSVITESFTGTIHPVPVVAFSVSPEMLSTSNSVASFTNETIGAADYFWEFGDDSTSTETHPYHLYDVESIDNVIVHLYATSEYGCVDSASIVITIKEEVLVYVPNTFTPDGDMHNPVFIPIITEGIELQDYSLTIYNRWGELIFESRDLHIGWDGTFKGKYVQDGTYTYEIQIKYIGESTREKIVGHVNLLR